MIKQPSRRDCRTRGFSMVELLVAMLMLMIVLVGLAALQLQVVRGVSTSRRSDEATRLAQRVLEQFMARNTTLSPLTATLPANTFITLQDVNGNPMNSVRVDGIVDLAQPGPFWVQYMIEQLTNDNTFLITVKVSWVEAQISGATTTTVQPSIVLTTRKL